MSSTTTRRAARLALPVAAILAVAGCGKKEEVDHELTQRLIQPVAQVALKVAKEAPGSRTGEQVYKNICSSCHGAGVLGAPTLGDTSAWASRLAQGLDTLTKHAIEGINQMPPRGGGADLTDAEVKRATVYMANSAGANFTEPPVEQ